MHRLSGPMLALEAMGRSHVVKAGRISFSRSEADNSTISLRLCEIFPSARGNHARFTDEYRWEIQSPSTGACRVAVGQIQNPNNNNRAVFGTPFTKAWYTFYDLNDDPGSYVGK